MAREVMEFAQLRVTAVVNGVIVVRLQSIARMILLLLLLVLLEGSHLLQLIPRMLANALVVMKVTDSATTIIYVALIGDIVVPVKSTALQRKFTVKKMAMQTMMELVVLEALGMAYVVKEHVAQVLVSAEKAISTVQDRIICQRTINQQRILMI